MIISRILERNPRWKSSRPAGRYILAIESLRRVYRHAPGGSHCISSSLRTPTRVHCWTSLFALPKDMLISHSLRKYFHAFSSMHSADRLQRERCGSRNICIHPDEVPFLVLLNGNDIAFAPCYRAHLPFESRLGILERA